MLEGEPGPEELKARLDALQARKKAARTRYWRAARVKLAGEIGRGLYDDWQGSIRTIAR